MHVKALRITASTYVTYRNMAALCCEIILPLPMVHSSFMLVETRKTKKHTKKLNDFTIWRPVYFYRAWKFQGVEDQMTFSEVKLTKVGKKARKAGKKK